MEDHYSVNSPRRVLSFSKRRKAAGSFLDPDDRANGFGVSGERGPKTSEVYGFVGCITTIVATVLFFVWAYVPESWLHSIGIFYYPDRYWALAIPTYAMVTIVLGLGFYIGINLLSVPPPASFSTIFDEFSRDPTSLFPLIEGDEQPIEPITDIGSYGGSTMQNLAPLLGFASYAVTKANAFAVEVPQHICHRGFRWSKEVLHSL